MSILLMILRLLNIKLVINQTAPEWADETIENGIALMDRDTQLMNEIAASESAHG